MDRELDEMEKDALELGIEPKTEDEEEKEAPAEEKESESEEGESKSDEEEKESESKEGEKGEIPQPKGKSIYKEFNNLRSDHRTLLSEKEDWQKERAALLEKASKYEELEKGKASEAEIKAAALELAGEDATPEVLAATERQIRVLSKLYAKPQTAASEEELQSIKEKLAVTEYEKVFNNDWREFESSTLLKEFKGASKEQIEEAQAAMDELAHAPQFADKEFDYIYFKNKEIFQEIFKSRPSRTFESRDNYLEDREDKPDLEEKYKGRAAKDIPIRDLEKMDREMDEQARVQDEEDGWHVKNPSLT